MSREYRSRLLQHDAIVIGTGQSGPALARRLVAAGQKVAVIERKFFGGTCVNTGCTPTKTLLRRFRTGDRRGRLFYSLGDTSKLRRSWTGCVMRKVCHCTAPMRADFIVIGVRARATAMLR